MAAMKKPRGAPATSARTLKIVERILESLVWSARATAWREGQDWEPEQWARRDDAARDHQAN
jgi:hypothetical protein